MARHRARRMGLEPIGTVGLLVLAHRRGLVDGQSAMTMIDTLVQTHGLYLSATILERVPASLARSN
jgi:predicted nucleic acid-binding protein